MSETQTEESSDAGDLTQRRVRSFVTRAGRISIAQQRAIDQLLPEFGIPYLPGLLDFETLFGRRAPVVLEIGFGMGETTAAMAASHREIDFLAIEVHTPGVGALLRQIETQQLRNVRIISHDAVEVLEQMVPLASLSGVHVFFPDPWHKARHHKRRLLQPLLVASLVERLTPGGFLHCATDWENYAEQIAQVLDGEVQLERLPGTDSRNNPLIARPVTKFETRGLRLGHGVWDLIAIRRPLRD